jgi:hypothetical protein
VFGVPRSNQHFQNKLGTFLATLCRTAEEKGMSISPRNPLPHLLNINWETHKIYEYVEKEFLPVLQKRGPVDFVLVVTPAKLSQIYAPIKRYFDCVAGLASQCIAKINVESKCSNGAFAFNMLMKINSKLGGVNVSLKELPMALRSGTV